MFKHMLIPTDGSSRASSALQQAVALAQEMGAKVTFLIVTEPFRMLSAEAEQLERVRGEYEQYSKDRADRHLQWARQVADKRNVACDTRQVESDEPYRAIIEAAQTHGCDVIAMGSHGYGGAKALLLGSVTQKVLTHCKIPVLVYR
jgi:nucleotide-binding universal stress UspA family protein